MTPTLESTRLILRAPKPSDWEDVYEGANDITVARNTAGVKHPYKKEWAKDYIKHMTKKWKEKPQSSFHFVIELKEESKVIGLIDARIKDENIKLVETGSWLNKRYRKKGYMSEAKLLVNQYVFTKLKYNKMVSKVLSYNKASLHTQLATGYKQEGLLRKQCYCGQTKKIHDEYYLGLLKSEWSAAARKIREKLNVRIVKITD